MSESGHSRRFGHIRDMSASPPIATIQARLLAMMIADSLAQSTDDDEHGAGRGNDTQRPSWQFGEPLHGWAAIIKSDRGPQSSRASTCRLPAPRLQRPNTAAVAPASWLRSTCRHVTHVRSPKTRHIDCNERARTCSRGAWPRFCLIAIWRRAAQERRGGDRRPSDGKIKGARCEKARQPADSSNLLIFLDQFQLEFYVRRGAPDPVPPARERAIYDPAWRNAARKCDGDTDDARADRDQS
jgi:hypothetical protein